MRETKIESNDYLGPFQHKLTTLPVGSIQRMHFVAMDIGPYWFSPADNGENDKMIPEQGRSTKRLGSKRCVRKGNKR